MMAAVSFRLRLAVVVTLALVAALAIPSPSHALEIKRMTLSNGAVLLVSPSHQLPMVTISIAFDAGSRRDPQGKAGLAALTAASLTQGTKDLSEKEFNEKVDFMGSSVGISADRDYAVGGMTSLSKYLNDTFTLLAGVLANPGLRDSDIERRRAETVAAIKAEEEQPGYVAAVTFNKMIFGDSPYGHPTAGSAESVAKLTPDDVRGFYHDHYKLGNAIIAVTGDVDTDTIKSLIEKDLSGLAGSVAPQAAPPAPVVAPGLHPNLIDRNVAQATILLGSAGIARSNPDFYKIKVMDYILGAGGFASRLVKVVRSKAGLAYSVTSAFETGKFPGAFIVSVQTKNKSSNEAISLILQQLREIQEKPVSDEELEGAKKFLIGSFPLTIDRQSEITSFMLGIEVYGLGLDYAERYPKLIGAVTKEDVQDVARKYLHPDALDLVAVANQGEAKIDPAKLEKTADGSAAQ